ncbi:hypothetical protein Gohar_028275, partial [Gossypium harknessii]|nr:hypothetical protein [Gossypium harknessii]
FGGLSGESICIDKSLVKERVVRDLFNESHDGWDKDRVMAIYGDLLGDQICNFPILHDAPEDRRIWFHNPHGVFTSKSAYSWLLPKQIGFGAHRIFWRIIWRLKTLTKICIFCWRLGHNILPTYEKISSFRSGFNDTCPRCGKDKETLIHALKDCPMARKVLEVGGLDNKLLDGNYINCVDWIEGAARILDIKALSDFISVLWNVWNSRNNKIFRGVEEEAKVTWDRATALSKEFRIFNFLEDPLLPRKPEKKAWKKSHQGMIKINFDASVHDKKTFYSLVARDADGVVLGGRTGFVNKEMHIEWAEMQAMEESINFAQSNNWKNVELESDCASLVNRFNKRQEDLTMAGHRLWDIKKQSLFLNQFNFCWAPRSCNKVADALCTWARTKSCCMVFNMDYPSCIHEIVLNDAIN